MLFPSWPPQIVGKGTRGLMGDWRKTSSLVMTNHHAALLMTAHAVPVYLGHHTTGKGAWDLMEDWLKSGGPLVRFRILNTQGVALRDPQGLKRVFQTRQRIYEKDLDLSYHPFLPILGTGLVTSDGDLWQRQRLMIGPALRTDILDEIIPIAKRAVDRLTVKLQPFKGSGKVVDIQAEFHLLTLQVIGEAVLSMAPEDCDKVRVCPRQARRIYGECLG